jgi:O-6-methylguanine DNA methyltransferase
MTHTMPDENRDIQALPAARALAEDLRALGNTTAPATLLPSVLFAVGRGDYYLTLDSPLGPVYVAYNALGISAVQRAPDAASFAAAFTARRGRPIAQAAQPDAALLARLSATLRGERPTDLRFDLRGLSEFERAVLLKALEIPRGEVRPYGWIAREIGRPRAVRAVGTALKHNPIPLLIPCHRVVRSDGALGEYALGGREAKERVLSAEEVNLTELERLARIGQRYLGSETTHIYCYPTCRAARRITLGRQQRFTSHAQAEAAGYRPCKICRPA